MTFGENLKNLRLSAKLSRKQVAEVLGMAVPAYGLYETGAREPRRENILKLADLFGVTTDTLLLHNPLSYNTVKAKLKAVMPIYITEKDGENISVKVDIPSDYSFSPAVNMTKADLLTFYKRAYSSPYGLEKAMQMILTHEYAKAIYVDHDDLRTVDLLPVIEEPELNQEPPSNDGDFSEFGIELDK